MKSKYQLLTNLFIAFAVVFLISCQDGLVTEHIPQEKALNMKTTLNKLSSNIEKKKIVLPLFGHNTDTTTTIDGTKALNCSYMYVHGWSIRTYAPKNGKTTGVWADENLVTWENFSSKYGFSGVVVSSLSQYNDAQNIGFMKENIMVHVPHDFSEAFDRIDLLNDAGYYYVDEPFERGTYNTSSLRIVASMVYDLTPGKMVMGSFKWPSLPFNFPTSTYGSKYKSVLDYESNSYIMCDEYPGNYWGTTAEYWTKFSLYYGFNKHRSAWMNVTMNAPGGSGSNFSTLFIKANALGMNSVWFFAGSIDNPTTVNINEFCYAGWTKGWLRGFAEHYTIVYKCFEPNPCEFCDEGSYVPIEIIWHGDSFEVYP